MNRDQRTILGGSVPSFDHVDPGELRNSGFAAIAFMGGVIWVAPVLLMLIDCHLFVRQLKYISHFTAQ